MDILLEIGMVHTIFLDYANQFKREGVNNPIGQAIGLTLSDFEETYDGDFLMEFAILVTIHNCVEGLNDKEEYNEHLDLLGERIDKLASTLDKNSNLS